MAKKQYRVNVYPNQYDLDEIVARVRYNQDLDYWDGRNWQNGGTGLHKGGVNVNIQEIKKDIVEYDLYQVVDSIPYGDYFLSIFNEGDKIVIAVYDEWGSAAYAMDKKDFLNINTTEELEKYINNIIYYNYEGE